MGFFNFMETFFFISLGITFILILLLIYHFKQRMVCLEQKSDTMFEIINNIVKEISALKQAFIQKNAAERINIPCMPNIPSIFSPITQNQPVFSQTMDQYHSDDEDSDIDGDEEEDNQIPEDNIKIINVNMAENEEDQSESIEVDDIDQYRSHDSDSDGEDDVDEPTENDDDENDTEEDKNIQVSPLAQMDTKEDVDYRKMTIQQLKVIVTSKGLSIETNKLKKNELIHLLESSK